MAVEALRIGIRLVFYPRFPGLRLLSCTDKAAAYWNRWFVTLLQLLGYGYLVVFPLIRIFLSPSLGLVFSALLALSAFVYGMVVVIVDIDADHRIELTDHRELVRDVVAVAGEPRL